MIIRKATPDDVPVLLKMAEQFLEATPYGKLFRATPESLATLVGMIFRFGDQAAILMAVDESGPVGMLAIFASPHPFTQELYADEVVWWVNPTARGQAWAGPKLLRSAEDWAREHGCYMIKMSAPTGSTVGEFYERLGYQAVETAFVKKL